MIRRTIFITLILSLSVVSSAFAFLGSSLPNITKFEGKNNFRQTVVYIDQSVMREGETAWAKRIATKLEVSLMPAEKVTIMLMDAERYNVKEIWSGAWPGYTAVEAREIKDNRGIGSFFRKDPLDTLTEERAFFKTKLGSSLGQIYSKRTSSTNGPKNILFTLASDEARFNQIGMVTRVILYSDMECEMKVKDLSVDFSNAIFYVFGINSKQLAQKKEWGKTLLSANGLLASFGNDLSLPAGSPQKVYHYSIKYTNLVDNVMLGDMILMVKQDGKMCDSYINMRSVSSPRASLLTGFVDESRKNIQVKAKSVGKLTSLVKGEIIELTGNGVLTGFIGHPEFNAENNKPAVFKVTATTQAYR